MVKASYPWEGGKPIFEYIQDRIAKGRLTYSAHKGMPDDDEDKEFQIAEGGLDGIYLFHMEPDPQATEKAQRIVELLIQQTSEPSEENRKTLYMAMVDLQAITYVDQLCQYLIQNQETLNMPSVYEEAMWLLWNATHREPLKVALAILGLFEIEELRQIFLTAAKHDEFTLFACIPLKNSFDDRQYEYEYIELCRFLEGWGKIQMVIRMEGKNERLRKYLIQEGCSNQIMNNYLAYHCAVEGDLLEVVSRKSINDKTYYGAQCILLGMLDFDGPFENLDDYDKAPQVVRQFMRHAQRCAHKWEDFFALVEIRDFLQKPEEEWNRRVQKGWSLQLRNESLLLCQNILNDERWADQIRMDLYSRYVREDTLTNDYRAGKIIGIDLWDRLFQELLEDQQKEKLLIAVIDTDDTTRLQKVADFLIESSYLPQFLETSPTEKGWFSLVLILQEFAKHPGIGFEFVWLVLTKGIEMSSRMRAMMTLESWARVGLDSDLRKLIRDRLMTISDTEIRQKVLQLI